MEVFNKSGNRTKIANLEGYQIFSNYLYSPHTVEKINALDINEEVVKLVEYGCELEDVESLIPNKLNNSIDEISNASVELLRSVPKPVLPLKKWID